MIIFSFHTDHRISLFKGLKLLNLHDILESDIIIFLKFFPRNELLKSVCTQLNLADEFHALDTRNNLLICISRTSATKYGNNVL